jgi:HEAT repeat protein
MSRLLPLLLAMSILACPARAVDPDAASVSVARLAGLSTDTADLLTFLRLRANGAGDTDKITALVSRLGAPEGAIRARAAAELIGIGPAAVPALRVRSRDSDTLGSAAARRCLQVLEKDSGTLTGAVLRLVASRRPEGATPVLLAFLPHAEDDGIVDEAAVALAAVAIRDGKPDPALVTALGDPVALRRAVAMDILCQSPARELPEEARKLLLDPVPAVRLRAALALARHHEPQAITTLVALLAELPAARAARAEECLLSLAEDQAPKQRLSDTEPAKCRDAWAAWWKSTEDSAPFVDEIRKRTRTDADRDKVAALIRGLGDDAFEIRQQSTDGLKALGTSVVPMLRQASNHPDLEIRQRVQTLLQEIEKAPVAPLSPTIPRVLAFRKPTQCAEALLAYLPIVDDGGILAEVQEALNAVAVRDGKPDPALVKALQDKNVVRRAAAAVALAPETAPEWRDAVRLLLKDPEPAVRVKAALALATARDRSAVPTLIALTVEPSVDIASATEDYLSSLAGTHLPAAVAAIRGTDAAARAKRRDAWAAWWQEQGDRVELPTRTALTSSEHFAGYTLLVQAQAGVVSEIDSSGRMGWRITGLQSPQDAQVLPGDRVLITESTAKRVTERNLKGDILWQKETGYLPISARRLPDGHTFIVSRGRISEMDRAGREVLSISRPANDVMTARKMADGGIAIVSSQAALVLLDATGQERKVVRLQGVSSFGNEVLAKGGVVVPVVWQNKVTEYDAAGTVVWEASVAQPSSAFRLPNGHTLVSTQNTPSKLVELDREGKQVAETTVSAFVHRATRR